MKVVCFFNTLGQTNIGLENFLSQPDTFERYVVVAKQAGEKAQSELESLPNGTKLTLIDAGKGGLWSRHKRLIKKIRRIGPVVIHAHHSKAALWAVLIRLTNKSSRLVVTAHANFNSYKIQHKIAFFLAFLSADKIVCNSEGTRCSLPSFIRNKKPIEVIHNGVNFNQIDDVLEGVKESTQSNDIIIGTVCRMVPQKDLETLIRGFAFAADQSLPDSIRLRLIGDGPERSKLEQLCKKLDVANNVEFVGKVSRKEVYRHLSMIDVFVVSSRWEGFCNAMVEAAAAKKAIITTDISPLPEVIGADNALFFPTGDAHMLAEHIKYLVKNNNRIKEYGAKASQYVRNNYALNISSENYCRVYKKLWQEIV